MRVEAMTREQIANKHYNWSASMAFSFNGSELPDDFPRRTVSGAVRDHKGKAMTYHEFDKWVRGVVV